MQPKQMNGKSEPTHLPLRGEVSVTSGHAKDERVKVGQVGGADDGIVLLGWGVHLGEDFFGERLGDSRCAYDPKRKSKYHQGR